MDKQFLRYLNQQVTWKPYVSRNGAGEVTYGTATTLACYQSGERKLITDSNGQEVISEYALYFNGAAAASVQPKDQLVLPDGRKPPILALKPFYGPKGQVELVEVRI